VRGVDDENRANPVKSALCLIAGLLVILTIAANVSLDWSWGAGYLLSAHGESSTNLGLLSMFFLASLVSGYVGYAQATTPQPSP